MATPTRYFKLPAHFEIEPELREQFSNRPGHQRCVEGQDELLLVVHEVPKPGIPEREVLFFWKRRDGRWCQPGGGGLNQLGELLDRYAETIDQQQRVLDGAGTAAQIFGVLRHAGPLVRSTRNLLLALQQGLAADLENREIRACRDRARELERAAELLHADARVMLEYWQAARTEEQARACTRLDKNVFRVSLVLGFFLPLLVLSSLCGMQVTIPASMRPWFWGLLLTGLAAGTLWLWRAGRQADPAPDRENEPGNE
jgi:hypothetical protein